MRSRSVLLRLALTVACGLILARPAAAQLPPFEVLHEFEEPGAGLSGPLIEATDGNFYGTTRYGGVYHSGTIFRMTRDYRVSTLYEFSGAFDGGIPIGKLLQASDGHLYGATYRNGAYDQGILYRFSLDGEFTILHAFNLALDSRHPTGSLLQGADGLLYGTASGSYSDGGIAFRLTLDGAMTVLHTFAGGMNDGWLPGPLIQASDGNFYGKTAMGGGANLGTLFRMTPAGDVAVLHRFTEFMPSDSGNATSRTLVQGADGNLYGQYGCGSAVFRITLSGIFTHLLSLPGFCVYGGPSEVELIAGHDGLLYATSVGWVYVIGLDGNASAIHWFDSQYAASYLLQSVNGHLYMTVPYAGAGRRAQVLRITPRPGKAPTAGAVPMAGAMVRLAWSPIVNAVSYTIRRRSADGSEAVVASGLREPGFVDTTTIRGSRYTYVVAGINAFGEGVASRDISIVAGRAAFGDFNGDGATDAAVFRPSTGAWHIRGAPEAVTWGAAGDVPVAADYDGDGVVDIAVFRPSTGTWYVRGIGVFAWGGPGDIPVPGYYRGGTAVDIAVFRPSTGTWYVRGLGAFAWGGPGDTPTPGDYDGDGRADLAVYRATDAYNATDGWYVLYATGAGTFLSSCCPAQMAPGDYDGDGTAELGLFDKTFSEWVAYRPNRSVSMYASWGGAGDTPAAADYNGDGLTDVAVFRESTGDWFVLYSGPQTGPPSAAQFRWGGLGDIPIQKAP